MGDRMHLMRSLRCARIVIDAPIMREDQAIFKEQLKQKVAALEQGAHHRSGR